MVNAPVSPPGSVPVSIGFRFQDLSKPTVKLPISKVPSWRNRGPVLRSIASGLNLEGNCLILLKIRFLR